MIGRSPSLRRVATRRDSLAVGVARCISWAQENLSATSRQPSSMVARA